MELHPTTHAPGSTMGERGSGEERQVRIDHDHVQACIKIVEQLLRESGRQAD